jgi:hypothetical protein
VLSNKLNTNHTYLVTKNYWAPLHKTEDEKEDKNIHLIEMVQSIKSNKKTNKWTQCIKQCKMMKLIVDSGATSNFVPDDMNLPKKGILDKEVYLPDNTKLKATYTAKLPLEQLSAKAREADFPSG